MIEPESSQFEVRESGVMPDLRGSADDDRVGGVEASFASAAAVSGVVADRYAVAGAPVVLGFASAALRERLSRAFAHLALPADVPSLAPALTVHLWDSASTGAPPPPRPATPPEHAAGALFHFHDPPLRCVYQPGLESLSVFDAERRTAWHWVSDAAELPYWEEACPIRQVLSWWLGSRGYLQVHGAAVGTPEGGVLIVGRGGSGKSTVALSCLQSDLVYAGDDYVAVSAGSSPRVASLYCSGKLDPPHLQGLLPALEPLLANRNALRTEKGVVYVHQHFPDRVSTGFPLRAILVPSVRPGRRESRVVEVARANAFSALAPSTIVQLHTAGKDAFRAMSRLVERVPCYGLEVGTDVAAIPGTVARLLSELPGS